MILDYRISAVMLINVQRVFFLRRGEGVLGEGGWGLRRWVGVWEKVSMRGGKGKLVVDRQLRFILSHQNDSASNNTEDGNKIMSEIHFLPVIPQTMQGAKHHPETSVQK